jgi:SAM-dependent methyltransferase
MTDIQTGSPFFKPESFAMQLAGKLGLAKLRWSLRRLHVPVPKNALVLEVGAGGNPYPRANVMLDAMESTIERNEQALIKDRPLVLGLCEELPFKDKSFDFIIASHVLEHTADPEKFLNELMRVGKAGYIETPEGWFEKMCAFTYHRLEVSANREKLFIRKKPSWKPDEIATLWDLKLAKSKPLFDFLRINPDLNHLRFYWKDKIDYEIVNPQTNAEWPYPIEAALNSQARMSSNVSFMQSVRGWYLYVRRALLSQNKRNSNLNIFELIRCPSCHSEKIEIAPPALQTLSCLNCNATYGVSKEVPKLFPANIDNFNKTRIGN